MIEVPVFYATTEGQTHRIAERVAATLRSQGFESTALEVSSPEAAAVIAQPILGAVVGASLHRGSHQAEAALFARTHAARLNACPSALFSVSLSAGSKNPDEVATVQRLAQAFAETTGWKPQQIACVAGRLAYTQYGFILKLFMRRIARKEGASTDTSRDHEFTDWAAVDRFAIDLGTLIRAGEAHESPAAASVARRSRRA